MSEECKPGNDLIAVPKDFFYIYGTGSYEG